MSIFGSNHLDGRRTHERLVVHELAHQWFGNSLTIARLAPHLAQRGVRDVRGMAVVRGVRRPAPPRRTPASGTRTWRALPADLVLADPGVARLFDERVYKRGALVLHALRRRVGDERFFALLRDWTARHRHATVTTAQFVALAERARGHGPLGVLHRLAVPTRPAAAPPPAAPGAGDP